MKKKHKSNIVKEISIFSVACLIAIICIVLTVGFPYISERYYNIFIYTALVLMILFTLGYDEISSRLCSEEGPYGDLSIMVGHGNMVLGEIKTKRKSNEEKTKETVN